jgi:hypothetical protein
MRQKLLKREVSLERKSADSDTYRIGIPRSPWSAGWYEKLVDA